MGREAVPMRSSAQKRGTGKFRFLWGGSCFGSNTPARTCAPIHLRFLLVKVIFFRMNSEILCRIADNMIEPVRAIRMNTPDLTSGIPYLIKLITNEWER